MLLPVANVANVIVSFVEQDLLPKGNNPQRWLTVFIVTGMVKQTQSLVEKHRDMLKMIGVLNDEDELNVEVLRDLALEAFNKSGPIEIGGIVFDKEDVSTMYDIAKKFSKE